MKAKKNALGLYEFSITVTGPKKKKVLKGIVDTGSTFCACSYKVITTLFIRPIDYLSVSAISGDTAKRLIYEAEVGFEGVSHKTQIARLTTLPDGIDFILGNSILDECKYSKDNEHMDVTWKNP
jgi:predicted aspartyl protease